MTRRALSLAALLVVGVIVLGTSIATQAEPPPPPGPDRAFYEARVAPWIEQHCVRCHRRDGAGFALSAAEDVQVRRRADFETLSRYVDRDAPWESRLILKLIAPGEGGEPHVGGPFVELETETHDLLLDFVSGSTLDNVPPDPYLAEETLRAKPGEEVLLDGRDSYDRDRDDMEQLVYWWTMLAKPPDSRVAIIDRRASRLKLTPDVPGSYAISLRVGDGKVFSAPRRVLLEVFERARIDRKQAGGVSELAKVEAKELRRIRRLYLDILGRPPTPAEARAETRGGLDGLFGTLAVRAEAGSAWYEELTAWYGLLGRYRPQAKPARTLALRIPAEVLVPPVVESALLLDPAFLLRHPPGRALARAVATRVLETEGSEAWHAAHQALARGESATFPETGAVADAASYLARLVESPAFAQASVRRRLGRFLLSGDVRRELPDAMAAVTKGGSAWRAYLVRLFKSRRYLDRRQLRAKDTVTYVRSLFFDLLERKPTEREMAAALHAVNQMPGRSAPMAILARVLIESGEVPLPLLVDIVDGPAWLRDRFLRYLGRPPRGDEFALYKKALQETLSPELIVLALVTTPEYACR